jgi:hypothetical protein
VISSSLENCSISPHLGDLQLAGELLDLLLDDGGDFVGLDLHVASLNRVRGR